MRHKTIVLVTVFFIISCNSEKRGELSSEYTVVNKDTLRETVKTIVDEIAEKNKSSQHNNAEPLIQEVENNLNWQWKQTYKKPGPFETEIRFQNRTDCPVLDALLRYSSGPDAAESAFGTMVAGQSHAPSIVQMYRDFRSKYGDKKFWELVITASDANHPSDLGDATPNINWQKKANPESIAKAKAAFASNNEFEGMYWLMFGQRHNLSICETYRATCREQRAAFLATLN
jgi:hypothetical protein